MKKITLIMLATMVINTIFCQSIEITDVKKSRFTGVKPILSGENSKIEGYYTFYMKEKGKKGMRTLEFSVIDKGIKEVIKTEVELHKFANLNNTVFNGKFFLVSYDDQKHQKIVLLTINREGKIVTKKEIPVGKKSITASKVYADNSGNGFYIVKPVNPKKKGIGYSIEKVNNTLEQVWSKENIESSGWKNILDLVNNKDRFIVWEEYAPKAFSNKMKPRLICFDAKTGDKIYEKDGYDGTSTILYNQMRIADDGGVYLGGAYVDGEKYKSANNTGIYMMQLDANGKEILYTKVNNKEQIQGVLKATSKGFSIGSKDKVFVEDLIIDEDNIIVISEMFRKNTNMTPKGIQQTRDLMTGKYVGWSNNSNDKAKYVFEIMDFMLFKFSKTGKLEEIKPISKENYNKITCWNPYASMPGMQLAKELDRMGWFDYGFTENDGNTKVMVCKNNASPKKPEVFMYTLDGNYAQKKINLKKQAKIDLEKSKVGYFDVIRNTEGNIAVVYYQPKIKKITINLETLH